MLILGNLILTAHLMGMMLASAGPLVAASVEWLGRRRGHPATLTVARQLATHALVLFVAGMLLGGLAGFVLHATGNREYGKTLFVLHRRLAWGTAEIVFSLVLLGWYVARWPQGPTVSGWRRAWHRTLAVLTATNMLYHFPPLMLVLGRMATGAVPTGDVPLDAAGFRQVAWQPDVIATSVHFALASFVLAGTWATLLAARLQATAAAEPLPANPPYAVSPGGLLAARVALLTAGLQFPVGLWLLTNLPNVRQQQLLGRDPAATTALALSVLVAIGLLHQLAALAFGDLRPRAAQRALGLVTAVIVLMVWTGTR